MSNKGLENIEITDADIDNIEKILGIQLDNQRRDIIKCMDDIIVQAFPGTGKTTVLLAKMAILGEKWPYAYRGICVISHTNIAREEIEKRLGAFGDSLLSYPNFIGTIQSFFDTFITLPWLKSNGYKIKIIDTDLVLAKRYSRLSQSTKFYFDKHNLDERCCKSLTFPEITLKINCNESTKSYQDVYNCVKQSMEDGYYTFEETLYIAQNALMKCKFLPSAIQYRFPIVLMDESQDTNSTLWNLINMVFPKGSSLRQFFGDSNQAIFQSLEGEEKAENISDIENKMTIPNSFRFDESIAHLANPLGIISGLNGNSSRYNKLDDKHMIFLFDDAENVLPAYAEYLLSCFNDEELNSDHACYAVGMVHKGEAIDQSDHKYPYSVKDYFPEYDPQISSLSYEPQNMIDYFSIGHFKAKETGDFFEVIENIAKGFRRYILLNTELDISRTGKAFNSLHNIIPEDKNEMFKMDFYRLAKIPVETENEWSIASDIVKDILRTYFNINVFNDNGYFDWHDTVGFANTSDSALIKENQNVFTYQNQGRTVNVKLSSIHAVKGMTHLSTLVLDTFWHKRNMESILPWLCGNGNKDHIGKQNEQRLKCHYVAMTRPCGLVCMSISKKSITKKNVEYLTEFGWKIKDL